MEESWLNTDLWFWICCAGLLLFLYQVFHLFYYFLPLSRYQSGLKPVSREPVTVVIAARNETENLKNHLPLIMDQDYPDFQVIVVNDRSWDGTADILEAFEKKYPKLHVITVHDNELYRHGKKMAVTLGIKGAKYNRILLTDADCKPLSRNWIAEMMAAGSDKEIILGYSRYARRKGLLNKLIRFDTVQIGLQYLSYALKGNPYMGVGRNLSYTKEVFERHRGFKKHYHMQSGDDDLFVNEAANPDNVAIALSPESQTESIPKQTFRTWFYQKKRHFTTSGRYKFAHKVLLTAYPLTFLLLFTAVVVSLFGPWIWVVLGLYLIRITIQLLIFRSVYKKLTAGDLLVLTPFLELVAVFINPIIHISNAFVKPKRWA